MKCSAYARYSSELQSAASAEDQLRACKAFILIVSRGVV